MSGVAAALRRRPGLVLVVLLLPPLAWLGVVYLGSLFALLVQSFFSIDDFSGVIDRHLTLHTYGQLFTVANLWVIARTVLMAALVTVACVLIAFPLALYIVRDAGPRARAIFYLGVMLPLWSNYLVRVYAWKLILAKEGVITWTAGKLGLLGLLEAYLELPVLGGPSLSISYTGTFIVFVYIWLPYMILPVQTAIERVPRSMLEASADLGAHPWQTFRTVLWPLALPGVVAGSIFTFSLTLGDYIIPGIVGNSRPFIGMVVAELQGVAGNLPLAAAFCLVPIVAMGIYLTLAKRQGAFDAL